jgi:hypothetical protein
VNGVAVAWLRSRRFPALAAVCLAVAVAGSFAADSSLLLPFVNRRFPMPLLLVLLPAVVLTTPLCDRFGGLERHMGRTVAERGLAVALAVLLVAAASLPAALAAGALFPTTPLLALMALAVTGVVALGALAWLPSVVVGMAVMYADFIYQAPVRSALDTLGSALLGLTVLLAGVVYAVRGPRAT